MKSSELRIGNFVQWSGNAHSIESIQKDWVTIRKKNLQEFRLPYHKINSILLTEEWLVRFGFTFNSKFHLYENNKDFKLNWEFVLMDIDKYVRPNFVHQLQNLYFALTGEEIVIKDGI